MLALGLNIVVGFAGLLDLGYIAFYAVGAYMFALLASPHLTDNFPAIAHAFPGGLHVPIWVVDSAGRRDRRRLRRAAGRADAEAARRLPGDRHPGLRRDHPHLPEQPRPAAEHHQRAAGHHPDRSGAHRRPRPSTIPSLFLGLQLPRAAAVLLPLRRAGGAVGAGLPAPAALAPRPRLDGDPRGRDRRQGDGHQHAQRQAAGLRHGRHVRRRRRRRCSARSRASCRPSRSR